MRSSACERMKRWASVLTASGYIVARNKAEISPKTVGRIAWINLEEGQKVTFEVTQGPKGLQASNVKPA